MTMLPLDGTALQADEGEIDGDDYLPINVHDVLWGELPCAADRPAVDIRSGHTLTIDTLSHEGVLPDQGSDPVAFFAHHGVPRDMVLDEAIALVTNRPAPNPEQHGPHIVSPRIDVQHAAPGDLVQVTVERLRRRVPYGVVSNRHGRGALPGEFPETPGTVSVFAGVNTTYADTAYGVMRRDDHTDATVRFPLSPFLGIMGVTTSTPVRAHSVPPGAHGGNIDINLLGEGTSVYFPVQVPGAGVYVGDPHFAQGDGEVALTAMEASLRATLRFNVIRRADAIEQFGELLGPLGETHEYLIPTGMDPDLDVAVANCVRAAIGLLGVRYGMGRAQALAYLSAATDFNISQVVDLVKGTHARIRKADFV